MSSVFYTCVTIFFVVQYPQQRRIEMAYSEAQKRASMKYNKEKYERIYMYAFPEEKEAWQAAADAEGISLSKFIKQCVNEKLNRQ